MTTTAPRLRHVCLISGKDSATLALELRRRQPEIVVEYIYNVTGAELPEVWAWLDRVAAALGQPIRRVGGNMDVVIADEGMLPGHGFRFCTRKLKIKPLDAELAGTPAVVYYGLRADEPLRVGHERRTANDPIIPAYPLRAWGIGLDDVYRILDDADLLPPHLLLAGTVRPGAGAAG